MSETMAVLQTLDLLKDFAEAGRWMENGMNYTSLKINGWNWDAPKFKARRPQGLQPISHLHGVWVIILTESWSFGRSSSFLFMGDL